MIRYPVPPQSQPSAGSTVFLKYLLPVGVSHQPGLLGKELIDRIEQQQRFSRIN